MNTISTFIKSQDSLGYPIQLTFRGGHKGTYNTLLGGCCSMLIKVLLLISLINMSIKIHNKQSYTFEFFVQDSDRVALAKDVVNLVDQNAFVLFDVADHGLNHLGISLTELYSYLDIRYELTQ